MSPMWGGGYGGGGQAGPPGGWVGMAASRFPAEDVPIWAMFRRLLGLLIPYRAYLIASGVLLLFAKPLALVSPMAWMWVIDDVCIPRDLSSLPKILAIMAGAEFGGLLLGALRNNIMGRAGSRMVFDLRNQVYQKLQSQSHSYFHRQKSGDLMTRTIDDVSAIQEVAVRGVDQLIGDLFTFVLVVIILIGLQWKIGLIVLIPMVGVWFGNKIFGLKIRDVYRNVRDRQGMVGAKLSENLQGMSVIKSFAREKTEAKTFSDLAALHLESLIHAVNLRSIFMPAMSGFSFLSQLLMVGAGAYYVVQGDFTVGGIVAYRAYWWMFFAPISTLSNWHDLMQRAAAAANRVFQVLDAPNQIEDLPDARGIGTVKGGIEFRDVRFSYVKSKEVLGNISFKVKAGERVALVGDSGAGKTTIMAMIMRFYDPTAGKILLDGQDLKSVTLSSLRRQMALVEQESFLFDATVMENILYGRPGASRAEVIEATKAANADAFIQELPKQYDTYVGERGVRLSGGQRQRIAVARAFLANPKVLILDEPTSSVEPESERIILQALERLMEGRTTLLVSHRISLVHGADKIIVIEGKKVSAEGSHAELMASNDLYRNMVRLHSAEDQLLDQPAKGPASS